MRRLSIVSSINVLGTRRSFEQVKIKNKPWLTRAVIGAGLLGLYASFVSPAFAQEQERESIEMSIMAVNPSDEKEQTVQIKSYLPKEITPDAIIDSGGLDVEFDSAQSQYYVYMEELRLNPSETRTLTVELQDVWIIPQGRLDSLRAQTESVISRLQETQFYDSAALLGETIYESLDAIATTQVDETVSRKSHIGIYRNNLNIVDQIKEDIDRLENQLTIASSLPKPDVLEESDLKTESPTESTSWMIIFIIMLFIGMLGGVFFFTWHAQARATKDLITKARDESFPDQEGGGSEEEPTQQ